MRRVITILTEARALITNPSHWTTGADARAVDRSIVFVDSPRAVCWCAEGAAMRVITSPRYNGACHAEVFTELSHASRWLFEQFDAITHEGITAINDHHGHHNVLAMFDRAIETATEKYATDDQ